ncbi:NAD(P)-binding protein [Aspergillus lucknowensis]|uniref:NAD(P)-binding protein n=1 Tax=Aspergillus lucknowensis TaxID=176173 RepID=A0ABR4M580_9EURO
MLTPISAARTAKDQPSGSSNRIERVAIIGAGGQIGRYLTEHLLKTDKHIVTAITRPSSTSTLPEGLRVLRVDYTKSEDDNAELVSALEGQQVLLITMSVRVPRDNVLKLLRAAAKAQVPYILPNWYGHDPANEPLLRDSMMLEMRDQVDAEIKRLGVSSTLRLACNSWYEFSLGGGPARFGFDFQKRTFTLFGDGNVPLNTTTWSQCGRAIASLLSLKELPENEADTSPTLSQFCNSALYIASFRLTQRDMFESVKRVTGTTDADWTITQESAEVRWKNGWDAMREGDWTAFPKMIYSRLFFPTGDGDYHGRELHNDLLNLPVEDLDDATAAGISMAERGELPFNH